MPPSPSQPSDQARFYELRGSLHRLQDRSSDDGGSASTANADGPPRGTFRRAEQELTRSTRGADTVPHAGNSPLPSSRDTGGDGAPGAAPRPPARRQHLPVWARVGLIGIAVLLLTVGIAGLFLPGLQGILTLLLALAVLSLVSRTMHRLLRWALGPWPGLRKRVERHRRKSHHWLHDRIDRFSRWRQRRGAGTPDGSDADSGPAVGDEHGPT